MPDDFTHQLRASGCERVNKQNIVVLQSVYLIIIFIHLVRGKIRAASGKARLLMTSKFKQFKDLCNLNAVSHSLSKILDNDVKMVIKGCFWQFGGC